MTLTTLAAFAIMFAVAAASPGPAVAAVVARSLGSGLKATLPFLFGLVLGDVVWLSLAVLGLAALAAAFSAAFLVLRYVGVAYLAWLAWRLWTAPATPLAPAPEARRLPGRLALAGLALALSNPKIMVFYLAVLPAVIDLTRIGPFGAMELAATIVSILSGVYLAYAWAADRARAMFVGARARRILNRISGLALAGAAVAVATK